MKTSECSTLFIKTVLIAFSCNINVVALCRIFSGDTTWKLTIAVSDCVISGSHLDRCPIVMSVRSGALPSNDSDSITVNCTGSKCILYAVNPLVRQWLYVNLKNLKNETLTARLKANIEGLFTRY